MVSDAACLVCLNSRSHHATLYTLSNCPNSKPPVIKANSRLHVLVKTIHCVPASVSEVETAGIFIGAEDSVPIIETLVELGHPQPALGTPIETNNSTAHNILTAQVCLK